MVKKALAVLALLTHPALLEAAWLSYWSRWQGPWLIAAWGLLVGVGGLLYFWLHSTPQDLLIVLGSVRRFLLLWNLLVIAGLWAATAELVLHFWLGFLLWAAFCAFLLHWAWEYSFHAYGWAALTGFYAWYAPDYPAGSLLLAGLTVAVGALRLYQGAHSRTEVGRGLFFGFVSGGLYSLLFT